MKKNESYRDRVKRLNKQLLGEASRFITEEDTAYQEFFRSALEKFGVSSPEELEGDKKAEFYDYVDQNWDAGENETDLDERDAMAGKYDEEPVNEEVPDSPGMEDFVDNMDDTPDPESAIREMIRQEIRTMMESKYEADVAVSSTGGDPDQKDFAKTVKKYGMKLLKWDENGPAGYPTAIISGPDAKAEKFFQDVYDDDADVFKL